MKTVEGGQAIFGDGSNQAMGKGQWRQTTGRGLDYNFLVL